jgi:iron complex outermembrane receptor protein
LLDEVVVYGERESIAARNTAAGTRTSTPLEKVPQSVQVLTRTLIEEQELQTISDALSNVSGVTPSSTYQTVLVAPFVRGFAARYYFDGLPTFQLPASAADPATLVGTERIEVVKGPTATLYGGASGAPLGGLINIVSRDPGENFEAGILVRGGSDATKGGQARVSTPLGHDARFALSGMYEEADSFLREVSGERVALFPTVQIDFGDATEVTLRGQYNKLEQLEYSGLPAALRGVVDRFTFGGPTDTPFTEVENKMATLELDHAFGAAAGLDFAVRRYENSFAEYSTFPDASSVGFPFPDTVYPFYKGHLPSEVEQTFATASAWFNFGATVQNAVLIGADYDDTDYEAELYLDLLTAIDFVNPQIDALSPTGARATYGAMPPQLSAQTNQMKTLALFVQDQITVGNLDITAGLRWTDLGIKATVADFFPVLFGFPPSVENSDESYSELTPRLGLTYRFVDGISFFAGYSEGFSGVITAIGIADPDPETSKQIETGLKFFARHLGLSGTVAAYQLKRRNVLTSDPNAPGQSIQAGEQRARGVEVDLVYEPSSALSTLFSYAYTDAEVTEDNDLPIGDRLASVPEHRGRLAARYRLQTIPLEFGAGITYTSERELTLPNTATVSSLTLVDAQASWDFGVVSLGVSVVNLTDRDGFEPYQFLGGQVVIPTQPRSVFATLRAQF